MRYQPKRSRKQWLIGAPEYVLACYDNGGKTADRYTVLIGGSLYEPGLAAKRAVECLCMSAYPVCPLGFSQWGEMLSANRAACGKHVKWNDLPENIRKHVIARCEETAKAVAA